MKARFISYKQALSEAVKQSMQKDSRVFVMGCGVSSPTAIFGSLKGIYKKFGKKRVIETPIAENGMTGISIGASILGMRPLLVHQRLDFVLLSMDQIINHAAKWHYMFGGAGPVPLTIRSIIGKNWGQGAQHSQSLQAIFAHVPGLKVAMPANAYDAKGLLISSIEDENPVIFIEHRGLYERKCRVPCGYYRVPLGKGKVLRKGKDVTLASFSLMVDESLRAAGILKRDYGIDAEVIDLRSLRPLDGDVLIESVKKTGRIVAADTGFKFLGAGSEIISFVCENCFRDLKSPPFRIGLPDSPTPTSVALEKIYYPDYCNIIQAVHDIFSKEKMKSFDRKFMKKRGKRDIFKGPF